MSETNIPSGWFAVKRGITQHPVFKGHPERLAIWLWLLDNAAWQDTPHDIKGKTVIVKRGSVCASERRIAEEVGVGRQVVRTFLARLVAERMINPDATQGRSIIKICNYEKYQAAKPKANPEVNPEPTHKRTSKQIPSFGGRRNHRSREADVRAWAEASGGIRQEPGPGRPSAREMAERAWRGGGDCRARPRAA